MKTLTILGARPQFIKAAPVLKLLGDDVLVHTGQHYDDNMSKIFFDGLDIRRPDYALEVGSGSHSYQITTIMQRLESIINNETPDIIIVYGDTNSTVAGAMIAKAMNIKLAHVEAGLRSYYDGMPEERNRVITDKLSDLLLCPTDHAYVNLIKESLQSKATITGDTMYDLIFDNKFFIDEKRLKQWDLKPKDYYLCTVHRPINVDNIDKLTIIFNALGKLNKQVILPCHPRTYRQLSDISIASNVKIIAPIGYMDMMTVLKHADKVITDSGGLQKEAHILEVPCVTLRDQTEWVESVMAGANKLTKIDIDEIITNVNSEFNFKYVQPYGNGEAARAIVEVIYG